MSQFNNNDPISQPQNAEFQEFVKGVRGRYGSGNYVTIGDIRESITELEEIENQTTDRVVSAINSNKAADAVIGENRRIYGINTKILKDTSVAPKLLGEIAANTGERQFTAFENYVKYPLQLLGSTITGNFFTWSVLSAKRADKASKKEDQARRENRKLDFLNYQVNLENLKTLFSIKGLLSRDANAVAEARNEQRSFLEKLLGRKEAARGGTGIDKKILLGPEKTLRIIAAIIGSILFRISIFLVGLDSLLDLLQQTINSPKLLGFIKSFKSSKIFKFLDDIYVTIFVKLDDLIKSSKGSKIFKFLGSIFRKLDKSMNITGIINDIKWAGGVLGGVFKTIRNSKFIKMLKPVLTAMKILGAGIAKVAPFILSIVPKVLSIGKPLMRFAANLMKFVPGLNIILAGLDVVLGAFKGFKMAEGEGLSNISGMFLGAIGGILEFFTLGFLDFESFFKNVAPHWKELTDSIMNFDLVGIAKGIWNVGLEALKATFKGVGNLFITIGEVIWSGIKWLLVKLGLMQPGGEGSLVENAMDRGQNSGLFAVLMGAWEKISNALGFIGGAVSGFFEKVKNAISAVFDPFVKIFNAIKNITFDDILSMFRGKSIEDIIKSKTPRTPRQAEYDETKFIRQGALLISRRGEDLAKLTKYQESLRAQGMYGMGMLPPTTSNVTNVYPTDNSQTVVSQNQMVNIDRDILYTSLRGP